MELLELMIKYIGIIITYVPTYLIFYEKFILRGSHSEKSLRQVSDNNLIKNRYRRLKYGNMSA